MTSRQLQQMMEIFDTALGMHPDERTEYLILACAGDEGLQSRIENLLLRLEEAEAEDFLARPVLPDPDHKTVGLIGRRVGAY